MSSPITRRAPATLVLALALVACKKSPPPVDFQSRARPDVRVAAAPDAAIRPDAGVFRAREGSPVPGDGRTLDFAGRVATAPPGQRFATSIPWDYDRDGTDDSRFVARVTDAGDAAGVSLVRALPDALEVANVVGPEPEDPSCGSPQFRQTSPRSLVLRWSCPTAPPPIAGDGPRGRFAFEAVLMGPIGADTGFRARVGVLRGGPANTATRLSIEGTDLDGDLSDELVVRVAVGREGAEPGATARFVYFYRDPAWAADITEPAASIRAQVEALRRRAGARRTAATVPEAVDDLLRLRRVLCQDENLQVVKLPGSTGTRCPANLFEGASEALLRAWVTLGELPAAWALTRAATAHPLGLVAPERVRALLEGATTTERGSTATLGSALPRSFEPPPEIHLPLLRWENPQQPEVFVFRGAVPTRMNVQTWITEPTPAPPEPLEAVLPTDLGHTRQFVGLAWTARALTAVLCPLETPACTAAWRARRGTIHPSAERRELPLPPPADAPPAGSTIPYANPYLGEDLRVLGWGAQGLVLAVRGRVFRVPPTGEVVPLAAQSRWPGGFPEGQSIREDGSLAILAAPEGLWLHEGTAWLRLVPEALRARLADVREVIPSSDGRSLLARLSDNTIALVQRAPPRR